MLWFWRARRDSNPRPSDPKSEGLGAILSVNWASDGEHVAIYVAISAKVFEVEDGRRSSVDYSDIAASRPLFFRAWLTGGRPRPLSRPCR